MKLTSSPKTLKSKTSLSQQLTRSGTATFKSTASLNSFQLCLWVQLELVNQSTFKMCYCTHSPVKSIWLLKLVSLPRHIATRSRILLTWNLTRSGQVFLDHVLEWNALFSLMILTCQRRKSSEHSHPLKFSDNLWPKVVGTTIKTRNILSVLCKTPL